MYVGGVRYEQEAHYYRGDSERRSRRLYRHILPKLDFMGYIFVADTQGRRHGFESGVANSASKASRKFFLTPHFLASGGTKYGVDISVKA